jgi:hypothetical protein
MNNETIAHCIINRLKWVFNRKGRKGLRKAHKDFKKICESVAKK